MARPNWEFIRVDVRLPRHPKLDGLPDATKWKLIELWTHCGEELTDGFVRTSVWQHLLTRRQRIALLDAGLATMVVGGVQMHDYLEHQRSKAEVEELIRMRRASGRKGGLAKAKAKQVLEQVPEQVLDARPSKRSSKPLSKNVAEAEAEAEAEQNHTTAEVIHSNVEGNGRVPESLPAVKLSAEAEQRRQIDALSKFMREHPEAVTP